MDDLGALRHSVSDTIARAQQRTRAGKRKLRGQSQPAPRVRRPPRPIAEVTREQQAACRRLKDDIAVVRRQRAAADDKIKLCRRKQAALEQEMGVAAMAIQIACRRQKELERRAQGYEEELQDLFKERRRVAHKMLETEELFARISERIRSRQ